MQKVTGLLPEFSRVASIFSYFFRVCDEMWIFTWAAAARENWASTKEKKITRMSVVYLIALNVVPD